MAVVPTSAGVAFALVCVAGLCAPLGASVVIFMKRGQRKLLASAIALAAGVMIFVSLTEVLNEANAEISHSGLPQSLVLLIQYVSFLAGMGCCWLLDVLTDRLLALVVKPEGLPRLPTPGSVTPRVPSGRQRDLPWLTPDALAKHEAKLDTLEAGGVQCMQLELSPGDQHVAGHIPAEAPLHEAARNMADTIDLAPLLRTGVLITLGLSLHNLPEGLATFVGYMSSPEVGITIAIAIAIHNIPEGIAIGVPVYFATGSKLKAVGWAAVSGVAEPLGALIGFAVYQSGYLNAMAMGIILGFTAGIMTGIAFRELIPRSMYYDATNQMTTVGITAGIIIMSVSFVLLSLLEPAPEVV